MGMRWACLTGWRRCAPLMLPCMLGGRCCLTGWQPGLQRWPLERRHCWTGWRQPCARPQAAFCSSLAGGAARQAGGVAVLTGICGACGLACSAAMQHGSTGWRRRAHDRRPVVPVWQPYGLAGCQQHAVYVRQQYLLAAHHCFVGRRARAGLWLSRQYLAVAVLCTALLLATLLDRFDWQCCCPTKLWRWFWELCWFCRLFDQGKVMIPDRCHVGKQVGVVGTQRQAGKASHLVGGTIALCVCRRLLAERRGCSSG